MTYATQSDIETAYGPRLLPVIADRDGDGVVDADAVAGALADASDEADTYLAMVHTVPLTTVPGNLRRIVVDIAVYRLAGSAEVLTEEHRRRYDDAVDLLKRIAEGKAKLPVSADSDGDGDLTDELGGGSPRPVVVTGNERLFTRQTLRGL
ncbi:MAG: DUF1320 domain-containing protein [Pseudomonadota bacterium]